MLDCPQAFCDLKSELFGRPRIPSRLLSIPDPLFPCAVSILLAGYGAALTSRRNTLCEADGTKHALLFSFLSLNLQVSFTSIEHQQLNFFFVLLLRKYNFFIPFLYILSIPQLLFQAQRRWRKMVLSKTQRHQIQIIIILRPGIFLDTCWCHFPFPLPQQLLARNRDSHKNTDIDIKQEFLR